MRLSLLVCVLLIHGSALGVDYWDFPEELREVLDERRSALADRGGICLAGRVEFSDGKEIDGGGDVKINLLAGASMCAVVYPDGWFILNRVGHEHYARRKPRVALRAFDYDPIGEKVRLEVGAITYVDYEMERARKRDRCSVEGHVIDGEGYAIEGARVRLSFPYASLGSENSPERVVRTKADGAFVFESLSRGEYNVGAFMDRMAFDSENLKLPAGEDHEIDLVLTSEVQVTIDYVYQPDGSADFRGRGVAEGRVVWRFESGLGMDFSDGKIVHTQTRDLELAQKRGEPLFRIFYVSGKRNGFYDLGEVDFDSVTDVAESGYRGSAVPCVVGHVYVVRTYEEGHYAKFVVTDIR